MESKTRYLPHTGVDPTGLRTVYICLLIFLSCAFGLFIRADNRLRAELFDRLNSGVEEVFNQNGVSTRTALLPELLPRGTVFTRNRDAETALAARLIGASEAVDVGGGILRSENSVGTVETRSDGAFEISLPHYNSGGQRSLLDCAEELLDDMGFVSDVNGLNAKYAETDGRTLSFAVRLNDLPIFNLGIIFDFGVREGVRITGSYPLGYSSPGSAALYPNSQTALMTFLRNIEAGGALVRELRELRGGFNYADSTLTPAWEVVADTISVVIS
jgi:hypothetical protein